MYINFKTQNYRGCINLETNDLYLSHLSPRIHRLLGCKHLVYSSDDNNIEAEVHEAIEELK